MKRLLQMTVGRIMDRASFWNLPSFVKNYELPVPYESMMIGGIETWFIPGRKDGPTVMFCHGNAGNLRFPHARRDRFLALHQAGANLWAFDYRGYGYSLGRPTEEGVYEDARAVHSAARASHTPGRPFVLFGRSLGGAVASYLATEVQTPDALILESTFSSAPDVCATWSGRALAELMSYRFDSFTRLESLQCPLYSIHGNNDWVVNYSLGSRLFENCPTGQEFVTIEGAGHNNLQRVAAGRYEATLDRWLALL